MTLRKLVSLRPSTAPGFGPLVQRHGQDAAAETRQSKAEVNADKAVVMSLHPHGAAGTLRLNLRWQGPHQVNDFKFDSLGVVQDYQTETEHTGWVTLQPPGDLHVKVPFLGDGVPFGGLHAGTEFPLAVTRRTRTPVHRQSSEGFWRFVRQHLEWALRKRNRQFTTGL